MEILYQKIASPLQTLLIPTLSSLSLGLSSPSFALELVEMSKELLLV